MKKYLGKIIALVLVLSLIAPVIPTVEAAGESEYIVENGVLLGYTGKSTTLMIPTNVSKIADDAFDVSNTPYCFLLRVINIPKSVKKIPSAALIKLRSVEKYIVASNNPNFSSYKNVLYDKPMRKLIAYPKGSHTRVYEMPDSVEYIDGDATSSYGMFNASFLKQVVFGRGFRGNMNDALNGSSGKTISINPKSNNYKVSDGGLIYSKDGKKLVYYPKTKKDKSFTIPDSCQDISQVRFDNPYLTSLRLGKKVKKVIENKKGPFISTNNLKKIEVASDNSSFDSKNGILYSKGFTKVIACPAQKTSDNIKLASTVKSIGYGAFCNVTGVKKITIPASVILVEQKALGVEYYTLDRKGKKEYSPVSLVFKGMCPAFHSKAFSGGRNIEASYRSVKLLTWLGIKGKKFGGKNVTWKMVA